MKKLSYFFIMLMSGVGTQEVSTPANLLRPRNFNYHPLDAELFIKKLKLPKPTKQGPVLFPNDGPPPPRTPLIVTSRPLLESIARSELNPDPPNNTVASQSFNRVSFVPYVTRDKEYRPYDIPTEKYGYDFVSTPVPYADSNGLQSIGNEYYNYQKLPPIYKSPSDHTQKKISIQQKQNNYDYEANEPDYSEHYQDNSNDDRRNAENNQNYAFSYAVKDQKTGDDFSHSQHSSGSATNGEYRVLLPDGRMQIVSYTADENGYKADVRYDEQAKTENSIDTNYNDNANKNNYIDRNNQQYSYIDNNNKHNNYIGNNNYQNSNGINPDNYNLNYVQHKESQPVIDNYNKAPEKDDYYNNYPDVSKEYYNDDYSSENNNNYQPYKSKFTFVDDKKISSGKTNQVPGSTVIPSYEQLKELFVTKNVYNPERNFNENSVQIIPSSTPSTNFERTTEHVVVIAPKPNLYTSIGNSFSVTPTPIPVSYTSPKIIVTSTPRSYLVSTIASLKNKVHLASKPILSDSFIERINKYLNFK